MNRISIWSFRPLRLLSSLQFPRIFSRFEKLDVVFLAYFTFALIFEALKVVWTSTNSNISNRGGVVREANSIR